MTLYTQLKYSGHQASSLYTKGSSFVLQIRHPFFRRGMQRMSSSDHLLPKVAENDPQKSGCGNGKDQAEGPRQVASDQ